MSFPSRLGAKLFAVVAAILLIGSSAASARPQQRPQASACSGFFCSQQSVAQTRAEAREAAREARRQAAEQAMQARQVALQQRAAARQQAIEARQAARHQSFTNAQATLPPAAASFGAQEATGTRATAIVTGGRPAGCPSKYCGCGASIEVFGRIIPRLNLAANWFRDFPRVAHANASANMVAGRPGHVFVLKEHRRADIWLVKDYNSGNRQTRLHERSIKNLIVVDPRGSRLAAAAY